ncbi:hypothetical protein WJT86_12005 [Microvirga sp. W0021]|uniref:Transcription factor zinc-finger domain-containing protein n=1 Tax=Hohaiivirga grylli TaxID=3133970 RepID=A0ABV0BMG6_9HYPH
MPKFKCHCGLIMQLHMEGKEYEFELVQEKNIMKSIEKLEEGNLSINEFIEFMKTNRDVYQCPKCRRLWIEEEKNKFSSYIKE